MQIKYFHKEIKKCKQFFNIIIYQKQVYKSIKIKYLIFFK